MRKIISKSVLCLVGMLLGINAHTQTVYVVDTSSPSSCDGAAYFIDSTNIGYGSFVWMDGNTTIQTDSTYIENLCAGTYSVTCSSSPTNSDTTIIFTIGSGTNQPCAGFYAFIASIQPADWGACNGSLTIGVQGGTSPYTYSWDNGITVGGSTASNLCSNVYYTVTVADANGCFASTSANVTDSLNDPCNGLVVSLAINNVTSANACDGSVNASAGGGTAPYSYAWDNGTTSATMNGLCPGTYALTVTDSNGCTTSSWASVYYTGGADSSMVVTTNSTGVSADGICDGNLTVQPWGGVAPYTYSISSGAVNTTGYFDSLCQGIYSVVVFDSNGDSVYVDVIVSNPGNNYNNNTYGDSLFVDSLLSDLQEDCSLNYQGIDSVYITGYNYYGDSIMVYWNVVSSSGTSVIMQSYYIGGPAGVYSLGIQVYCPAKSIGNYFTATDQIYYTDLPLGISEQLMGEVSIHPNPATDVLNVTFGEAGNYEIALHELTGRVIMTTTNSDPDFVTLDISALAKGQYILMINGNKGTLSKSVVK